MHFDVYDNVLGDNNVIKFVTEIESEVNSQDHTVSLQTL